MTHYIIHNHLAAPPRRARDGQAGRAVERDEEERNRDRIYRDSGITRVGRDASPAMQEFLARKAKRREEASAGIERGEKLINRAKAARAVLKKRGESPYNGYAANSDHFAKMAKASYGLALNNINNGGDYQHEQHMASARAAEAKAEEAVAAIERQAGRAG